MGPNVIWLADALTSVMPIAPGSRVLDLGCGRAASSIFLARELDVHVVAADLWVDAGENWRRIRAHGLAGRVLPLNAEAHALPFADGYFDAIVCLDAYHYFGTDDLYLASLVRFLRSGGSVGIIVPGLQTEFERVPNHLEPHWDAEFWSFHSPAWWRQNFERSGLVDVVRADLLEDGWQHWLHWLDATVEAFPHAASNAAMIRDDAGRTLGLSRIVAVRSDQDS